MMTSSPSMAFCTSSEKWALASAILNLDIRPPNEHTWSSYMTNIQESRCKSAWNIACTAQSSASAAVKNRTYHETRTTGNGDEGTNRQTSAIGHTAKKCAAAAIIFSRTKYWQRFQGRRDRNPAPG